MVFFLKGAEDPVQGKHLDPEPVFTGIERFTKRSSQDLRILFQPDFLRRTGQDPKSGLYRQFIQCRLTIKTGVVLLICELWVSSSILLYPNSLIFSSGYHSV
jgi:hypothetical protein